MTPDAVLDDRGGRVPCRWPGDGMGGVGGAAMTDRPAGDPRPVLRAGDEVKIVEHGTWTEVYRVEPDGSLGPLLKVFTGYKHVWRAKLWPVFAERSQ